MKMFVALAVLAFAPSIASAEEYWVSCGGCGTGQAQIVAEQGVPAMFGYGTREDQVYVVDTSAQAVFKFGVITDREPGLYSRYAYPMQVEGQVDGAIHQFWNQVAAAYTLDVPQVESPSATEYLTNPFYSGRTRNWLAGGATGFMAQVAAAMFAATTSANQALAALGADRGPAIISLAFSDGSRVQVEVTIGHDAITGEPVIANVEVVPDSAYDAEGNPVPTSPDRFNNYQAFNLSSNSLNNFLRLAQSWGIPIVRACSSSGSSMSCDAQGRCTVRARC